MSATTAISAGVDVEEPEEDQEEREELEEVLEKLPPPVRVVFSNQR